MSKAGEKCSKCGFGFAWDGSRCDFCHPSRTHKNIAEERAFLEAMQTHPDDDLLPLVYADWLDDQGDLRGSLLRLELERLASPIEGSGLHRNDKPMAGLLSEADFFALRWYVEIKQLLRKPKAKT